MAQENLSFIKAALLFLNFSAVRAQTPYLPSTVDANEYVLKEGKKLQINIKLEKKYI